MKLLSKNKQSEFKQFNITTIRLNSIYSND